MKRLVLLLLLLAAAFAQCDEIVSDLELDYANYLYTDSIDCQKPHTETIYANLSQLAEGYSYAAQCFKEETQIDKARAYYSLAGEKYFIAGDALCSSDYSLQMQLYISSGDAYQLAKQDELARASYDKSVWVYHAHNMDVDAALFSTAQQRIYELEHPLADGPDNFNQTETADWVPYAIGLLVFIGIGLVILYLKIKK